MARSVGVGLNDLAALDVLSLDGPLGPVEIGHHLGMRSASATALVDRLEASGHVERHRDPADRRRITVVPTRRAGEDAMRALAPMVAELDDVAAGLTEDELAVVRRYLDAIAEVLRRHGPAAR